MSARTLGANDRLYAVHCVPSYLRTYDTMIMQRTLGGIGTILVPWWVHTNCSVIQPKKNKPTDNNGIGMSEFVSNTKLPLIQLK